MSDVRSQRPKNGLLIVLAILGLLPAAYFLIVAPMITAERPWNFAGIVAGIGSLVFGVFALVASRRL